jgi:hypothetical protein
MYLVCESLLMTAHGLSNNVKPSGVVKVLKCREIGWAGHVAQKAVEK